MEVGYREYATLYLIAMNINHLLQRSISEINCKLTSLPQIMLTLLNINLILMVNKYHLGIRLNNK